ncbi:MAG: TVP38/TMEM64 family protein, partial [Mastigocladus sp. ERB_26_2]
MKNKILKHQAESKQSHNFLKLSFLTLLTFTQILHLETWMSKPQLRARWA